MKYYCIGIKGSGMSTLAQILKDLGNEVSGYDDERGEKYTEFGLKERNIPIYYDSDHKIDPDTIVTYSKAFSDDHKEILRVKNLGLKIMAYNEVLAHIITLFDTVSVCGTHGKTSTSSMIRHILEDSVGCNYFIGAGDGYASHKNKYFVIESDEFNRHFLAYHPSDAVITNIELEHTECYKDIDDIKNTFQTFANGVKNKLIVCGDDDNIRSLDLKNVTYYGFDDKNDVVAKNINIGEKGMEFDVFINKEKLEHFFLPLFGKHMVLNALAAITYARFKNIDITSIKNSLASFKNAKRRFAVETIKNYILIDDYAHHPTEIKVTLKAVREKYPDKRLVAVFVPNTYSRTLALKDDFIKVLKAADQTYLTEIDCNREKKADYPGVNSMIILNEIPNGKLISVDTINQLKKEENAVICFLGCADTSHLIEAFKKEI